MARPKKELSLQEIQDLPVMESDKSEISVHVRPLPVILFVRLTDSTYFHHNVPQLGQLGESMKHGKYTISPEWHSEHLICFVVKDTMTQEVTRSYIPMSRVASMTVKNLA